AEAPKPVVNEGGVEMVQISPGEFLMADNDADDDESPAHRVRLSPFVIDVCEVTQESFRELMGRNPSKFEGSDRPVDQVSWHDAAQYCNMRSLNEGLTPCYHPETLQCDFEADGYRLPTEAEWEYACRAGTTTKWSFGGNPRELTKHAWFKGNAGKSTHPVKQKDPNPWGLYDMHGNVSEWCHDFYREGYGPDSEGDDPRGPASGEKRVVRGGCWALGEDRCRSSARAAESPGFVDACFKRETYGFRCVRRAESNHKQP
ncbi:MAG: formylglycine-generating enzyme family protein, partial [Planctomycetota bacterium]